MKNLYGIILLTVVISFDLIATIVNVPADTSTIQGGIYLANNGDTVLVDDGRYYENINFKGKAITVASHFLWDDDTSHISNTIIDGSNPSNPDSGSVVYFISGENTTSILCGFTIINGTGSEDPRPNYTGSIVGGGICCYQSSPRILNCHITENNGAFFGSGIFCSNSNALLENLIISQNTALLSGAGIYSHYSSLVLKNITIFSLPATPYGHRLLRE